MGNEFDVGNVDTDFVSFDHEGLDGWDGEFQLPSSGEYVLEVDAAKNETASTGAQMLSVNLRIMANSDGSKADDEGKMVFAKYFPAGKEGARNRLVNFLKACGALEGRGYRVSALKGRRLIAKVVIEEGKDYKDKNTGETKEGKPQARVQAERAAA